MLCLHRVIGRIFLNVDRLASVVLIFTSHIKWKPSQANSLWSMASCSASEKGSHTHHETTSADEEPTYRKPGHITKAPGLPPTTERSAEHAAYQAQSSTIPSQLYHRHDPAIIDNCASAKSCDAETHKENLPWSPRPRAGLVAERS